METYSTEEEQVEAIRRWWAENGRSTIVAIVLALATGFGWQYWKDFDQKRSEAASHVYQNFLESLNVTAASDEDDSAAKDIANTLKDDFSGTSYAQFAALHLAKLAVKENNPVEAQTQLRWVLGKAPAQSDMAEIAQLRLARVLASSGDSAQAMDILSKGENGTYAASYAIAIGDIYMHQERYDDARAAYARAKSALASSSIDGNIATLDQKIQSLNPVPAREINPPVETQEG